MSPRRFVTADMDQSGGFERPLQHRLRRAQGQVRAVQRGLDERQPCEDIVTQLLAARSAPDQGTRRRRAPGRNAPSMPSTQTDNYTG